MMLDQAPYFTISNSRPFMSVLTSHDIEVFLSQEGATYDGKDIEDACNKLLKILYLSTNRFEEQAHVFQKLGLLFTDCINVVVVPL